MRQQLTARFYDLLWNTTAERDKFEGELPDGDTSVPAWVKHERHVLLAEVNVERGKRGLAPLTEDAVKRGERVGDPLYGRRLAEHCAGLAVGE